MNGLFGFAVGVLCLWRLTHLVVAEAGPFKVFARLRRRAAARRGAYWGELLACHYCTSLVIAAPVAALLAEAWRDGLLLWPALSAGGILLERFASLRLPEFFEGALEEPNENLMEEHHELLRTVRSADIATLERRQDGTGG